MNLSDNIEGAYHKLDECRSVVRGLSEELLKPINTPRVVFGCKCRNLCPKVKTLERQFLFSIDECTQECQVCPFETKSVVNFPLPKSDKSVNFF